MFSKLKRGEWKTVAIDAESHGWRSVRTDPDGNPVEKGNHILVFQVHTGTNERRLVIDDSDESAKKYAEEKNSTVAECRTLWIRAGKIEGNPKNISYIDRDYAPHGDFEDVVQSVERNKDLMSQMEDNPQVKQAWEHFVASVKLTKNL